MSSPPENKQQEILSENLDTNAQNTSQSQENAMTSPPQSKQQEISSETLDTNSDDTFRSQESEEKQQTISSQSLDTKLDGKSRSQESEEKQQTISSQSLDTKPDDKSRGPENEEKQQTISSQSLDTKPDDKYRGPESEEKQQTISSQSLDTKPDDKSRGPESALSSPPEKKQQEVLSKILDTKPEDEDQKKEETKYRILIIGKTGNGKSSVGNGILGQKSFPVGSSMASTTTKVHSEEGVAYGCQVEVVDTPDPVNDGLDADQLKKEIQKWKEITAPGLSAILLAVRCDVRYTAEEYDIYKKIKEAWGDNSFEPVLIIVFTFGDRQEKDLEEELKNVCPELTSVLKDCRWRYVCFNNKASKQDVQVQVQKLFSRIDEMTLSSLSRASSPSSSGLPALPPLRLAYGLIYLAVLSALWKRPHFYRNAFLASFTFALALVRYK